jgi:hypothetical protein
LNFTLQSTTNVSDAASWRTLTNVPAVVSQQNAVTNAISGAVRFYRLIQ